MTELNHLDWIEILKNIQGFATSGAAKISIGNLHSCSSPEEAQKNLRNTFDASQIVLTGTRPHMESLDLYEPWFTRIKKNAVLKTLEIRDVRHFCLEILALREATEKFQSPYCKQVYASLMDASEPLSAIDQILTPRGEIRSDASETLYRLFNEKENLARQVQGTLDKLVNDHQMNNLLQDKYVTTREGRWVLPIRSGMQHYMPGVIHGSSQTKQTVFMEPEAIIPMNNRLRQVEVEIEDEIERLLVELSKYLYGLHHQFATAKVVLEEADVVFAKAQWSLRIEGKAFTFSEDKISLKEIKHPLLAISGKPVVANTVLLNNEKSILLLSGPNAGGKTVLLKSIGLAAQMARCGLPLCGEEGSELPFFKNIQVAIGDQQNVGAELSTFAGHLKVLEHASRLKNKESLVLVDEICGSTDPEEGSALARSFIESFSKNQIFAVITSHLGPLKTGWQPEDKVLNGSLEYDAKSGRPTYQFLQGIPGDSLAIQTAKRVGVSKEIVERALELLTPETRVRLSGLEEIEQMKSDIQILREHLKKETAKAKFEKDKYEKLLVKFDKEKEEALQKVLRQSEKKIDEMISHAKADQTFKRHTALQEIKTQMPEVIKSKAGVQTNATSIQSAEDFAQHFPPGSKVFVQSLNQDGLIQSTPNSKGEVQILANSLRLTLPWTELKPAHKAHNPTADLIRRSSNVTIALQDSDKTVDLRGMTVEEALSSLEIQLDNSAIHKEDRIKIIHGHGTETLKKAVRTYLSRSVYVKKWKAGSPEQGGDGVTWAELGD